MNKLKRLMCRLMGHKNYATMGGVRCARCGSGYVNCFINRETIAAMTAQFMRGQKIGGR